MTDKNKDKPKHLGRGLQSLLGPITGPSSEVDLAIPIATVGSKYPPDKELQSSLTDLNIDSVRPNPYQPRTIWDENELKELADSIKANGVIQPIIVRRSKTGGHDLIAGERRLRAAKLASLKTIPALVRQATDEELLELALVENIHRRDLNPIERSKAYEKYINTFSLTQEQAAQRLGESRAVVTNYLRLLDLPQEIKQMLIDGQLSMGHARAILGVPTDDLRRKLANRAMAGRLSVREVERLVRRYQTADDNKPGPKIKPAHIHDLEINLSNRLGTRVSIDTRKNGQKGRISIEFSSLDEFDRIAEMIGLTTAEEV
ncbi:MAG: ParB/RepB/Spo0J family partition protein [Planctomycetota bacterium]